jgi:hypothetical protein
MSYFVSTISQRMLGSFPSPILPILSGSIIRGTQFTARISTDSSTAKKINSIKSSLPPESAYHWDKKLKNKVMRLAFGQRKYDQFKPFEKELIDRYQEDMLEDGPLLIPNSRECIEQDSLQEWNRKRKERKG